MNIVRKIQPHKADPVAGGFYTVREAARLLNIPTTSNITKWLQGGPKTKVGPVLERQYQPVATIQELSFWDLLEVRFIVHFRQRGVTLQALRKAAQTARELWRQQHPFALSRAKYLTDRQSVFELSARETNDTTLLNLVTRQYAMYEVLEDLINRGLDFDPTTGLAREWRPKFKEFPSVFLNPLIAFGKPIIGPTAVPTLSIFQTWEAEDGDYSAAADWYGIDETTAREAVEFELSLPN